MEPTPELIDAIYRDKVRWARETPPHQKLLDGPELFDQVCQRMLCGIRNDFPDLDEGRWREILFQRIARIRQLEGLP